MARASQLLGHLGIRHAEVTHMQLVDRSLAHIHPIQVLVPRLHQFGEKLRLLLVLITFTFIDFTAVSSFFSSSVIDVPWSLTDFQHKSPASTGSVVGCLRHASTSSGSTSWLAFHQLLRQLTSEDPWKTLNRNRASEPISMHFHARLLPKHALRPSQDLKDEAEVGSFQVGKWHMSDQEASEAQAVE